MYAAPIQCHLNFIMTRILNDKLLSMIIIEPILNIDYNILYENNNNNFIEVRMI